MFDNVVKDNSRRMSAELCAALMSPKDLASLVVKIRDTVETLSLLPLTSCGGFCFTLARGEILIGNLQEPFETGTGRGFNSFRSVFVDSERFDVEALGVAIATFEGDPEEPPVFVWGIDCLAYALLHELTGAGGVTLARTVAVDLELSSWNTEAPDELPEHVLFLVEAALAYHSDGFSTYARCAPYGFE